MKNRSRNYPTRRLSKAEKLALIARAESAAAMIECLDNELYHNLRNPSETSYKRIAELRAERKWSYPRALAVVRDVRTQLRDEPLPRPIYVRGIGFVPRFSVLARPPVSQVSLRASSGA